MPHRLSPIDAVRIARMLLLASVVYVILVLAVLSLLLYLPAAATSLAPDQYDPLFQALWLHAAALLLLAAAYLVLRHRRTCPTIAPKLMTPVVILAGLVSVDRLLCIPFPPPTPRDTVLERHPVRGWTNRRHAAAEMGGAHVRTDAHGLRVDEAEPHPPSSGARRLLFVGDSVTLGYYFPARAAFCEQTVDILNARGVTPRFHALNAGTCGYDTAQQRDWLEQEGFRLNPDLIVLQFCLNDVSAQYDPASALGRAHELAEAAEPPSCGGLHRALRAAWWRYRYGGPHAADAAAGNAYLQLTQLFESPEPPRVRDAWSHVRAEFEAIAQACRRRRIPLIAVSFPIRSQLLDPDLPASPQEAFAQIAGQVSIPCLDLLPVFRAAVAAGESREPHDLYVDETHPSALGHRMAAEALVNLLKERGLD